MNHSFCSVCKKVSMLHNVRETMSAGDGICTTCYASKRTAKDMEDVLPIWRQDDGVIRYDLPEELKDLTHAEKLLISPLLVYVPLHHMEKGNIGCKGHVCCFEQDVASMSNILPRLPKDVALVRVIKKYKEDDGEISTKTFRVRKDKVIRALMWLKKYSIAFEDVEIDLNGLSWMQDREECVLPAATEKIIDADTQSNITPDEGPAPSQVSDIVKDQLDTEEISGSKIMNSTGGKMGEVSSEINQQISEASKKW